MKFWIIRKGTTTMKLRAADIFEARRRAAAFGLKDPDSIVLAEGVRPA